MNIAFSKSVTVGDGDVVYEQWQYSDGGMLRVPWGVGDNYPNTTDDDVRPVPLLGTSNPFFRRLFVDRDESPCEILEFNIVGSTTTVIASSPYALGRPATSYLYDSASASPHYVPVTWEEKPNAGTEFQIYMRIR